MNIELEVTYRYQLEIDENNDIVKEYESIKDLLYDCASYRFNILPVLGKDGGVKVTDVELLDCTLETEQSSSVKAGRASS